ncbi:hypothetical protein SNE40_014724 [Patella caerulea]|uniref:Ig-like domain-containing protein n=1 Tax=Patella caerulea TaxID=87958 RepID=A0AAN8JF04_PATCE
MDMVNVFLALLGLTGLSFGCNTLRIRDWDLNDVQQTYEVAQGGVVALICDGTCQGTGFTPSLRWSQPSGREVDRYPERVMSVFQESRRQLKLYLQDFRPSDQGMYTCRGWVNGSWKIASVYLKMTARITTTNGMMEEDKIDISNPATDPDTDLVQPLPQPIIAR